MMNLRILYIFVLLCTAFAGASAAPSEEARLKKKVDPYLQRVEKQPDWLYSRLQMYWTSHATDVYINGERFDHVGGARAKYATVKMAGTRGMESAYSAPKLEDVIPYYDDAEGSVMFVSRSTGKMEKANPAKTGTSISALNCHILGIARDASRLYVLTHDDRYAKMALGVFDVYLKGIYGRNVPIDLNHGHQQTLVGMTTFEVIHEDAINLVADIYANLGNYISRDRHIYDAALMKWAENIIANGVPHNNWNLFQAKFISRIALVLQPDSTYADHRGRDYYLDYIVNQSSVRQWSMARMAQFGFDPKTAIWYESPGYSTTVLNEMAEFANQLDLQAGIDLFVQLPILTRAIMASPQYLFPNRMIVGFGDTHPTYLSTSAINNVIDYARRHGNKVFEQSFTQLLDAVQPTAPDALVARYTTPIFYAPNVSWLVQRSGMNKDHDLMISLNGSLGNHQHANGISMELYGKGYVLGPDAGIGKYLYSGRDYEEYYSQFPAHNTVCVDGVSSYPVMMSNHGFEVVDSGQTTLGTLPSTYSVVAFVEPESQADQQRTNAIVKTSATGGYYVDVFRSRKMKGGDKTHDYFYHNLGQQMSVTSAGGEPLRFHATDELAFAGGHLYAYSYIYNKEETDGGSNIKAEFVTNDDIRMNLWMRRDSNRSIIKALSPVNLEYERMPHQPYDIKTQPVLTLVVRQRGEAWNHPFVAIYEPSSNAEPSEIADVSYFNPQGGDASAVGIKVTLRNGATDYVFSSPSPCRMSYDGIAVSGRFGVVRRIP